MASTAVGVPAWLLETMVAPPSAASRLLASTNLRDRLTELIAWLDEEYGPLTDEEFAEGQRELDERRADHARRRAEGTRGAPRRRGGVTKARRSTDDDTREVLVLRSEALSLARGANPW
jgi:hypothetical protein